jgi:hypothetical protein
VGNTSVALSVFGVVTLYRRHQTMHQPTLHVYRTVARTGVPGSPCLSLCLVLASVEEGGVGNVRWLKAMRWACLTVHSSSKRFGSAGSGGPRISPIASWGAHETHPVLRIGKPDDHLDLWGGVRCSVGNHELASPVRSARNFPAHAVSSSPGAHTLCRIHQTMHIASCLPSSTARDRRVTRRRVKATH